jgi:AcrR family transcriptional regulator
MRQKLSYCLTVPSTPSPVELRVIAAAKTCCERWGIEKVTIDDIAAEAGVSRATLYRLFPGGKDVLFEALRVRELEDFFTRLTAQVDGAVDLEDLLVRAVVAATHELRDDQHLAIMMASEPGDTLAQLTVEGLPRIMRVAGVFLVPMVDPYLPRRESSRLVELLSRLVISYFLAPSDHVDLGDADSARLFISTFILPAFLASLTA